jgi:hypothetical protein
VYEQLFTNIIHTKVILEKPARAGFLFPRVHFGRISSTQRFGGLDGLALRQASEQYFTDSQFFAQLLRQVISRPQAMHGLLGR